MIMYTLLKIISFIYSKNNKYICEKFWRRILGGELSDKFCFQFFFYNEFKLYDLKCFVYYYFIITESKWIIRSLTKKCGGDT